MKFRTDHNNLPKTSAGKAKPSPLSITLLRWYAWAEELASRFGVRTQRMSSANRIFLLRQVLTCANHRTDNRQTNWHPLIQLQHYSLTFNKSFSDNRKFVNIKPENRNNWAYLYPKTGPKIDYEAPVEANLPQAKSIKARGSRFLTEMIAHRHRQNNSRSEKREELTGRLVKTRQRVDSLPVDGRALINARRVFHPSEALNKVESPGSITPGFHQKKTNQDVELPDTRQIRSAAMPANTMQGITPPQLDLSQLTDQVIRQLDRRMTIWRERTGRI